MKNFFILIGLITCFYLPGQENGLTYEKVKTFFPNVEQINQHNIEWGLFTVPENWNNLAGKKIKLATSLLKNTTENKNANALIMIEGGPGASGLEGIWWWLNHPLRKTHDIILIDIRGTGFSEPRLCPELGKEFLNILAKNQDAFKDEKEKAEAALRCQQNLIAKGVDINNYHSQAIAKDIHALKQYFAYPKWSVYGVSYGTYVAQNYVNMFPNDVNSLILDSPISDISKYYSQNTSNYLNSLRKVFTTCKNNPDCDSEYPNLESIYDKTIKELKEKPITVKVSKDIIPSGEFTYNAEDFKVAIHQALYQKKLIEVLPLLINQFHERNEAALSSLVAAFSGALGLDYGVYYCVTCNEAIPQNSFNEYTKDIKSQSLFSEGLSFYKSDFVVCDQWNRMLKSTKEKNDTLFKKNNINVPTLILTGGFDPITPTKNGKALLNGISNAQLIEANSYGHASSFSRVGFKTINSFVNNPNTAVKNDFKNLKTDFVKDIHINGGIAKMGNSLNNIDLLFFTPLIIAILISLIAIFVYVFSFLRKKGKNKINNILKVLLIITSVLSIVIIAGLTLGLNNTASNNPYILAFGLSQKYRLIFDLITPFIIFLAISVSIFFIGIKRIKDRSILFTVLFSNTLILIYLLYWGIR